MTSLPTAAVAPTGALVGRAGRRDAPLAGDEGPLSEAEAVDELVARVGPVAAEAVDALQVAASLEADGITDDIARADYGYDDVFLLAEEVRRRSTSVPATPAPTAVPRQPSEAVVRDVSHGLLYLLPAAVFPAVLAVLGLRSLVVGLVVAGCVGWVWAGVATWLGYRLLGRDQAATAARVLRWSAVAGLPVAAAASLAVVATTQAGYGLVAMATAQMAFQMAAALLVFYRQEVRLFVGMAPGAVAGVAYVLSGEQQATLALVLGGVSVAVTFGAALWHTTGREAGPTVGLREGLSGELGLLPLVVVYTALSAVYLLHAQARYMLSRFDVVGAFVPLIVGMGVVEWRARRFSGAARALLRSVRYPREFVVRIWRLVARDVAVSVGVTALLAVAYLAALYGAGELSVAAVLMTAASVVLAGAYFIGFLLANMTRFMWLCGALATCIAVHVVPLAAAPEGLSPNADTAVFLASAVLLFVLQFAALAGMVGQARHHR